MERRSLVTEVSSILGALASAVLLAQTKPSPPPGFTALFNGKDLSGWRGRPGGGGVFSPYVEAKFTPEERAAKQKEWNDDRDLHWRVDTAKGEIVSDGYGVHLATEKAYGDFELRVDWLLTQPGGDSGIYLRDYPQVQLWDPANPRDQKNARLGDTQRQANRRGTGARQLLRSNAAGAADRFDRAADARVGSALPQHLHSRDSRVRGKGIARNRKERGISPVALFTIGEAAAKAACYDRRP
jgi:3-keto-disaccharide hydrolase